MVDTVLSMGAVNKQAGPIRWDLKTMKAFPQWELDTRRAIRAVAVTGFLESKRPSQPEVQQAPGFKRQNTPGQQDAKTVLLKVQEEWDQMNMKIYEILEERVLLCEADVNIVRGRFGDLASAPNTPYNGIEFFKWICSH